MSNEKRLKMKGREITYVQKRTQKMDIPYRLTVKDGREMYLNDEKLWDLTPEEQLILMASADKDPTKTPENTIAAIFQARQITKRCKDAEQAIQKCFDVLYQENKDLLDQMEIEQEKVQKLNQKAGQLSYYLDVQYEMEEFKQIQASPFASIINAKNRIAHFLRREPYSEPPYTERELDYSRRIWAQFRKDHDVPDNMTNQEALLRFKYGSLEITSDPFDHVVNHELLDALQEEYTVSTITLQILDGSAYEQAKKKYPHKNVFPYLKPGKEAYVDKQKALKKTRVIPRKFDGPEL